MVSLFIAIFFSLIIRARLGNIYKIHCVCLQVVNYAFPKFCSYRLQIRQGCVAGVRTGRARHVAFPKEVGRPRTPTLKELTIAVFYCSNYIGTDPFPLFEVTELQCDREMWLA